MNPNTRSTTLPGLLLAEDDPPSRSYLEAVLKKLGCEVTSCVDGRSALSAARKEAFDLLLIDRHLPGLDALAIIQSLRSDGQARSRSAPAIASSAEWDAQSTQSMLEAGYLGILTKPCSAAALQSILLAHLPYAAWPLRNDTAALDAAGNANNLAALQRLFMGELEQLRLDLPRLHKSPPALVDRLHRLCASAGFCGAPAMTAASTRWLQHLRANTYFPDDFSSFVEALEATSAAFSVSPHSIGKHAP